MTRPPTPIERVVMFFVGGLIGRGLVAVVQAADRDACRCPAAVTNNGAHFVACPVIRR